MSALSRTLGVTQTDRLIMATVTISFIQIVLSSSQASTIFAAQVLMCACFAPKLLDQIVSLTTSSSVSLYISILVPNSSKVLMGSRCCISSLSSASCKCICSFQKQTASRRHRYPDFVMTREKGERGNVRSDGLAALYGQNQIS